MEPNNNSIRECSILLGWNAFKEDIIISAEGRIFGTIVREAEIEGKNVCKTPNVLKERVLQWYKINSKNLDQTSIQKILVLFPGLNSNPPTKESQTLDPDQISKITAPQLKTLFEEGKITAFMIKHISTQTINSYVEIFGLEACRTLFRTVSLPYLPELSEEEFPLLQGEDLDLYFSKAYANTYYVKLITPRDVVFLKKSLSIWINKLNNEQLKHLDETQLKETASGLSTVVFERLTLIQKMYLLRNCELNFTPASSTIFEALNAGGTIHPQTVRLLNEYQVIAVVDRHSSGINAVLKLYADTQIQNPLQRMSVENLRKLDLQKRKKIMPLLSEAQVSAFQSMPKEKLQSLTYPELMKCLPELSTEEIDQLTPRQINSIEAKELDALHERKATTLYLMKHISNATIKDYIKKFGLINCQLLFEAVSLPYLPELTSKAFPILTGEDLDLYFTKGYARLGHVKMIPLKDICHIRTSLTKIFGHFSEVQLQKLDNDQLKLLAPACNQQVFGNFTHNQKSYLLKECELDWEFPMPEIVMALQGYEVHPNTLKKFNRSSLLSTVKAFENGYQAILDIYNRAKIVNPIQQMSLEDLKKIPLETLSRLQPLLTQEQVNALSFLLRLGLEKIEAAIGRSYMSNNEKALNILGVNKASTQGDIKDAFKRLSLLIHPDKAPMNDPIKLRCDRAFNEVKWAKEILLG